MTAAHVLLADTCEELRRPLILCHMARIPAATFLRKITDPHIYGLKRLGEPQAFAKKEKLQARLNESGYGYRWNNATFLDHCRGAKSLYYYTRFRVHLDGADRLDDAELLPEECIVPYFDIDVNKSKGVGSASNARKAIEFLANYFPGLYSEVDRRAYPLIWNDGYGLSEVKAIFKRLEGTFNDLLTRHAGIEKFEILGMPAQIYREHGAWKVDGYGTFGKLPTQLLTRFDEFALQPVIRMSELEKLLAGLPAPEKKPRGKRPGSTTNNILNEDQLELIPEVLAGYKDLSYYCMAMRQDDPAGRRKVTALDFQIGFAVLSACILKPNANGQLPGNRIKAIWNYLFENEYVARGFDGSRWKVIRDTMEDCGFLEMVDNTYWFDPRGVSKGKAMEWSLKPEFGHDFSQTDNQASIYCGTLPQYVPYRSRPLRVWPPVFDLAAAEEAVERLFAMHSG